MPDTINPYIPGQPVDNPDSFFGRRDVLSSIREHLVKGRRVFVVAGASRMGKSSLLRQVAHHLPEDGLPVRLDLLEENPQKLDWLLWRLAEIIGQDVARALEGGESAPAWEDFEGHTGCFLDDFWPRVRTLLGERVLVLLVDDLDSLAGTGDDLLRHFVTLLSDWRDRDGNVALVLGVSATAEAALVREHPRLFGGAMSYLLSPLASEESMRLITWPVDGILTYDYGLARRLIEATSGHPYYLQLLCFEVFNRCAAAGWVNQRDVDLVVEDIVAREIDDFRLVWHESTPPEQAVLAAIVSLRGARGVATVQDVRTALGKAGARAERVQVGAALERLVERGILERLGALSYRFRVALLRDWLAKRIDFEDMVRNVRWDSVSTAHPSGEPSVARLTAGRRKKSPSPRPEPADAQAAAAAEDGEGARRPWLWLVGAAAIILVLAFALGPRLFSSAPASPTPTLTLPPSATARLATATLTSAISPTPPAVAVSTEAPTITPTPLPSFTPSPTPPVVVARPVPAIAYQSRGSGDSHWSIYVMDSDGSNRTALGRGQSGFLAAPTWSPDGTRIAFVSDRDGNPDIWVMAADGSNPINLTADDAGDHSPAWSPDGEWIAFASLRDSLYWELYLMRPDGSDVQRLTWWEDASDLSPTWSPDGTRLAFASKRDGNWEIYTMDRDGDNLARLTADPADDTNPAWSPDGSRIAFVSLRQGYAEIYVMPVVGGQPVNVSNAPFSSEHGPTWSPDGGRIAFYSDRDGEWDIYVMNSDGSDAVKLTGDNSNDQVPAWRP